MCYVTGHLITYTKTKLSAFKLAASTPWRIAKSFSPLAITASPLLSVILKSSNAISKLAIPRTSTPDSKSVMMLADSGNRPSASQNWSAPSPPVIVLLPPLVAKKRSTPSPPTRISPAPKIARSSPASRLIFRYRCYLQSQYFSRL